MAGASDLVERTERAVEHQSRLEPVGHLVNADGPRQSVVEVRNGLLCDEGALLGLLAGPGVPQLIGAAGRRIPAAAI